MSSSHKTNRIAIISVDSVQQTHPTVYAYWVTKPSIFFPEKQAIHTLAIEPQMRSEKFKLPLPSTIIYTSHRNIWLLLHISSRLRRQPANARPRKQSLGLYMSLSFTNPSESGLQTIRRERGKATAWERLLPALWRCKQRLLFRLRCGYASSIHLCAETRQESLIFHNNTRPPALEGDTFIFMCEGFIVVNYEHVPPTVLARSGTFETCKPSKSCVVYLL